MNMVVKFGKKAGPKTPAFGESWARQIVVDTTDFLIDGKSIPAASLPYLILNGIKQSLADSYAGAENFAEADGAWGKRLEKIMSGNPPTAGGRETDPFEVEVGKVILAKLTAIAKKKNAKLPKGDDLKALKAAYRAKHKDEVEAEAQRRLDALAGEEDFDLDLGEESEEKDEAEGEVE